MKERSSTGPVCYSLIIRSRRMLCLSPSRCRITVANYLSIIDCTQSPPQSVPESPSRKPPMVLR